VYGHYILRGVAVRYCVTRTVICSEEVSVWQEGGWIYGLNQGLGRGWAQPTPVVMANIELQGTNFYVYM